MPSIARFLIPLLLCSLLPSAFAQAAEVAQRPRIGLVLGGGGDHYPDSRVERDSHDSNGRQFQYRARRAAQYAGSIWSNQVSDPVCAYDLVVSRVIVMASDQVFLKSRLIMR